MFASIRIQVYGISLATEILIKRMQKYRLEMIKCQFYSLQKKHIYKVGETGLRLSMGHIYPDQFTG